ncbi:MAG TPA: hypothetical protein PKM65_03290 [Spirochaetota bacterium]|nr:hypothetical protein [Spirochaetota bacterium]HNT10892.1 hypothetical protein [Spirochaetota bacterium]HOS41729.1 hypothetical protein [Spirochaetota bacterium]
MKIRIHAIVVAAIAVAIIGCATGAPVTPDMEEELKKKVGYWVDNHTFVVIANGQPTRELVEKKDRRHSSHRDAILFTQKWVLDRFYRMRISAITEKPIDYRIVEISLMNELARMGIVVGTKDDSVRLPRTWTVLRELYDRDDACEMIVQIRYKSLKDIIYRTK